MVYQKVDLSITQEEGEYQLHVRSSLGEAKDAFELPFSDLEIENFILKISKHSVAMRRVDSSEMEIVREFGGALFDALFGETTYARFRSVLDQARLNSGGVEIRLLLDGVPELTNVPWEYLFDTNYGQFYALSINSPLVRFFRQMQPVSPLVIDGSLRILGVISNPDDLYPLNVQKEKENLEKAISGLIDRQATQVIEVVWLTKPTLAALRQSLRQQTFHVLHFVGHGSYDAQSEEGVIYFEDERGRGQAVSASVLGTLLHDHFSLRLVVLNACEGARTGRVDPFGGVAPTLIRAGIPSVIAMQFDITDAAAILFAQEFYGALADGQGVYAALSEARKAIFSSGNEVEWATPVVFSSVDTDDIFQFPKTVRPPQPDAHTQADRVPSPAPVAVSKAGSISEQRHRNWVPLYVTAATIVLLVLLAVDTFTPQWGLLSFPTSTFVQTSPPTDEAAKLPSNDVVLDQVSSTLEPIAAVELTPTVTSMLLVQPITAKIVQTSPGNTSSVITDSLVFQIRAYMGSSNQDGDGIGLVELSILSSNEEIVFKKDEVGAAYCAFGGNTCNTWDLAATDCMWPRISNGRIVASDRPVIPGLYMLHADVHALSGAHTAITQTITINPTCS